MYNEDYLFNFEWGVYTEGYRYSGGTISKKSLLGLEPIQQLSVCPKIGDYTKYKPFDLPENLAKKFSQIQLSKDLLHNEDIIAFASKYGLLGLNDHYGTKPERLCDWHSNILTFKAIYLELHNGRQDEALLHFNGIEKATGMDFVIPWEYGERKNFQLRPKSLMAALWIMLGNEISLGSKYLKCQTEGCTEYFRYRKNKLYCSKACKQASYRQKLKN